MTSKYTAGPWRVGDAGRTVFGPPTPPQPQESSRDRWAAGFTRGFNKLIKQAQTTGQHEIHDGGCTYRFRVDATVNGIPLFP